MHINTLFSYVLNVRLKKLRILDTIQQLLACTSKTVHTSFEKVKGYRKEGVVPTGYCLTGYMNFELLCVRYRNIN